MIEAAAFISEVLKWERQEYSDLEIGLPYLLARHWVSILCIELGIVDHEIGFFYCTTRHKVLNGRADVGESPFDPNRKRVRLNLYPPHSLRTLGHEMAHIARWCRHGLTGHRGTWPADLKEVHTLSRKHLPRLHWCDLPIREGA